MAGFRDVLLEKARGSLNAIQDAVQQFDANGGVSAWANRVADRAKVEEERFVSGKHPLNPEYRTEVKRWYARMELQPGASADDVRRSFRALMRKYHPDRYTNDAEHESIATQLSQELTIAYQGLLNHLGER